MTHEIFFLPLFLSISVCFGIDATICTYQKNQCLLYVGLKEISAEEQKTACIYLCINIYFFVLYIYLKQFLQITYYPFEFVFNFGIGAISCAKVSYEELYEELVMQSYVYE